MPLLHLALQPQPSARPIPGRAVALAALLGGALIAAAGCTGPGAGGAAGRGKETVTVDAHGRVERVLFAMGTRLRVEVTAVDRATALTASEAAVLAIEDAEARLSTWDPNSELSRLNAWQVGLPFQLSPATAQELGRALELARITGGAFDPTVGALVEAWDLRGAGRVPTEAELADARSRTGHDQITLDGIWATRSADVKIDAGAFGKGAGLDAALAALKDAGAITATVDLGGQLMFLGHALRYVPVAHPEDREVPGVEVRLTEGSIATSGNSVRFLEVDGRTLGHILDPHTGWPLDRAGSATALANSALDADALATAAFVRGHDATDRSLDGAPILWLQSAPDAPLTVHTTPPLRGRVRRVD